MGVQELHRYFKTWRVKHPSMCNVAVERDHAKTNKRKQTGFAKMKLYGFKSDIIPRRHMHIHVNFPSDIFNPFTRIPWQDPVSSQYRTNRRLYLQHAILVSDTIPWS
uniref:Uncharacterized protein n=1 Tax=Cacopsylla melanoneura TaxID=428564 RepID=A0A8D8QVD6_9HEMI